MTTLSTLLITRWQYPMLHFHSSGRDKNQSKNLTRILTAIVGTSIGVYTYVMGQPNTKPFYLSSIVWWTSIPLTLLLTMTLPYAMRRWKAYLAAIWISTVYLWFADQYALRRDTWHIAVSSKNPRR
jgi:hypothetical protein